MRLFIPLFILSLFLYNDSFSQTGVQIEYEVYYKNENPLLDVEEIIPDKVILSVYHQNARIEKKFDEIHAGKFISFFQKNDQIYIEQRIVKSRNINFRRYNQNQTVQEQMMNRQSDDHLPIINTHQQHLGNSNLVYPMAKEKYNIKYFDDRSGKKILDYSCKRATAESEQRKIEILYSDAFGHQFFLYGPLNGIALQYKIKDHLFDELIYKAVSIKKVNFNPEFFDPPKINVEIVENELINKLARSIKVRNLKNDKEKLTFNQGKITVINFWSVNSLLSFNQIPKLNRLCLKYNNDDRVQFIAVARNRLKYVDVYLRSNELKYQVYASGFQATRDFEAFNFPTNVIIDPNGKIVYYKKNYWTSPAIAVEMDLQIQKLLDEHFNVIE